MESNLQQRHKKEEKAGPDIQTVTQNDGQKAGICPNCNAEIPVDFNYIYFSKKHQFL